jgi:hypothetical protein
MAISKQIIKQNGLNTNYHKIANIIFNYIYNNTQIVLESYISKEIREKGIKKEQILENLKTLSNQYESAKDSEIIAALAEKIQTLQESNKDILNKNFVADQTIITLDYIPQDTTFEGIYKEIMNLEEYKDSDMI